MRTDLARSAAVFPHIALLAYSRNGSSHSCCCMHTTFVPAFNEGPSSKHDPASLLEVDDDEERIDEKSLSLPPKGLGVVVANSSSSSSSSPLERSPAKLEEITSVHAPKYRTTAGWGDIDNMLIALASLLTCPSSMGICNLHSVRTEVAYALIPLLLSSFLLILLFLPSSFFHPTFLLLSSTILTFIFSRIPSRHPHILYSSPSSLFSSLSSYRH
mmetsp:Transcript_26015/g.66047  ORF Transcript_26015/g.66047 Transcript_26015/m.66047 type:complete len:215 (+) Transcript_26015:1166-1810(+)